MEDKKDMTPVPSCITDIKLYSDYKVEPYIKTYPQLCKYYVFLVVILSIEHNIKIGLNHMF